MLRWGFWCRERAFHAVKLVGTFHVPNKAFHVSNKAFHVPNRAFRVPDGAFHAQVGLFVRSIFEGFLKAF